MGWDVAIIKSFAKVDPKETIEAYWYGPYNMLLNDLFPYKEEYKVAPQFILPPNKAVDFTTLYLVSVGAHPVFFLEVKAAEHLDLPSARNDADAQIRSRFADMRRDLHIPRLWGISAMGTQFSVYQMNTKMGEVRPPKGPEPTNPGIYPDYAPISQWAFNVLEQDGETKLRRIAADVKAMAAGTENLQIVSKHPTRRKW